MDSRPRAPEGPAATTAAGPVDRWRRPTLRRLCDGMRAFGRPSAASGDFGWLPQTLSDGFGRLRASSAAVGRAGWQKPKGLRPSSVDGARPCRTAFREFGATSGARRLPRRRWLAPAAEILVWPQLAARGRSDLAWRSGAETAARRRRRAAAGRAQAAGMRPGADAGEGAVAAPERPGASRGRPAAKREAAREGPKARDDPGADTDNGMKSTRNQQGVGQGRRNSQKKSRRPSAGGCFFLSFNLFDRDGELPAPKARGAKCR